MKVVLAADLHIGRASSRVPDVWWGDEYRASRGWDRLVQLAIFERASAVCLSGDVADRENRFWESIGPLEQGVRQLASEGITTIAVSGNHDCDVLPRLADQLPSEAFHLVGRGGRWERFTLCENGDPVLHVDGWSFPQQVVARDPIDDYDLTRDDDLPILGMVHGDLDDPNSDYAPLSLSKLDGHRLDGWLLGHIHAPRLRQAHNLPWVLYPGSLQALDPGEPGCHGAWVIEVKNRQISTPVHHPLSTIHYGTLDIDLSGAENEQALESTILQEVKRESSRIAHEHGAHLRLISLRINLTGRTALSAVVARRAEQIRIDTELQHESIAIAIEQIEVRTLPAIDLQDHANSATATGALARLILDLESESWSDETQRLVSESVTLARDIEQRHEFTRLDEHTFTAQEMAEQILSQSRALLSELLAQGDPSRE